MRRLFGVVGVLAVLVVAAELVAPEWVAARAEAAISEETGDRAAVEVDVSGPPLLTPVLATGQVEWLALYLSELGGQRVPVDVTVELDGVTLDRGRLLRGDLRVTEVDRAQAVVYVDLSGAVPPALQPMADRLAEVGLPRLLEAVGGGAVSQVDGELVLGDLSLPLVDGSCSVSADEGVVITACDLAEVPPWLLTALD